MIKIIVKKEPKNYSVKIADSPRDGEMQDGYVIEVQDKEFTIEQDGIELSG